jgi:outer membrane lipoprotein-sorting protein
MVKKPSSLRLEILPLIGPPELILSVHGNILKVFLPQKGEFYIGQASEKNLGSFFPFSTAGLQIEDIISILFGTHPPIKEKSFTLRGSSDEGLYRVDILSEKRKIQSLLIDSESYKLMRVNLFDNDNNPRYSVRFFGQSVTENLTIPEKITLASGDDENPYITIRYSDAQRAAGVDAASFDLQPPSNITTISMD